MPIAATDFEKGKTPTSERGSNVKPKVEKFLQENSDKAYSTKEIFEEIGANSKATVNTAVRKLEEQSKVRRLMVDGIIYNRWVEGAALSEDESEEEEAEEEDEEEDDEDLEED